MFWLLFALEGCGGGPSTEAATAADTGESPPLDSNIDDSAPEDSTSSLPEGGPYARIVTSNRYDEIGRNVQVSSNLGNSGTPLLLVESWAGEEAILRDAPAAGDVGLRDEGAQYLLATSGAYSFSLGAVGDADGDGIDDVIAVSTTLEYDFETNTESYTPTWKLYLGPLPLLHAESSVTGESGSDSHPSYSAGDVTGDGLPDTLAVGYALAKGTVFRMPLEGNLSIADADVLLTGSSMDVSAPGDLDGDGVSDLLISANGDTLLFVGPVAFPSDAEDATLPFAASADRTFDTLPAGDVNGDGYDDLLAQHYYEEVFVLPGPFTAGDPAATAIATFQPSDTDDRLYFSARGGDANGDGYADTLLGDADATYLFYGPASGVVDPGTADAVFTGEYGRVSPCEDSFLPDADGDGRRDLLLVSFDWEEFAEEGGADFLYTAP